MKDPFATARREDLRFYVWLIAIAALSLAVGLGLELSKRLEFTYQPSDIVGWISTHQYPKQQEFFFFGTALIGTPVVVATVWLCWVAFASVGSWASDQSVEQLLKRTAFALLPLLLFWLDIQNFNRNWMSGLGPPVALTFIALCVVALTARFKLGLRPPARARVADPVGPAGATEDSGAHGRRIILTGLVYLVIPALLYFQRHAAWAPWRIDLFHWGDNLAPLYEVLRGALPFRDVYLQRGLIEHVSVGWLGATLFGPTLEGVSAMYGIVEPLGIVAFYFLGLQVLRDPVLSPLLLAVFISNRIMRVSPRAGLALIAFALVANVIGRHRGQPGSGSTRDDWQIGGAGAAAGLAFWYSTETGLYAVVAIGLFLAVYSFAHPAGERRVGARPLLLYLGGALVGFMSVGSYFVAHGALGDVFRNTHIQMASQLGTWGLPFPPLEGVLRPLREPGGLTGWGLLAWSTGIRGYWPVLLLMGVASYLTCLWLCRAFWHSRDAMMLLLLLLGGATFFRTALGRSDSAHVTFGATLAYMLCLVIMERGALKLVAELRSTSLRWVRSLGGVAYGLALVAAGVVLIRFVALRVMFPPDRSSEDADRVHKVVTYLREQTRPNQTVFDFSNAGAYHFFADRPSPTRFHKVIYASPPELQREVIDALERHQTRLVIFKSGEWYDQIDGVPGERRLPLIAEYLASHYAPATTIEGTEILLRRP